MTGSFPGSCIGPRGGSLISLFEQDRLTIHDFEQAKGITNSYISRVLDLDLRALHRRGHSEPAAI